MEKTKMEMVDIVDLYLALCEQHLESLAVIESKLINGEAVSDETIEDSRELTRKILSFEFDGFGGREP